MVIAFGGLFAWTRWSDRDKRDYPDEVRRNFAASCESAGGTNDYCSCGLDEIENEMTLGEYLEAEQEIYATGIFPAKVIDAAAKCGDPLPVFTREQIPPPAPPPVYEPTPAMASFVIEASNTRTVIDFLDLEYLCVDFAATNDGTRDGTPFGYFSMVRPSGTVTSDWPAITDGGNTPDFLFPVVIPGAVSEATKCFSTEGERGTFTVRYEGINGAPGSWPVELS